MKHLHSLQLCCVCFFVVFKAAHLNPFIVRNYHADVNMSWFRHGSAKRHCAPPVV